MSRFGVLAVGALLALGACSDNKSAVTSESSTAPTSVSSAPDTTGASDYTVGDTVVHDSLPADTVVDDTSVDDTSVDETFAADPVDPNAAGFGSDFCAVNEELNQTSDYDPFKATPADTEAYFSIVFPDMLGRLQDSAPDELTADVAVVGTAFGALISELESNGWDFSAAYAVPAVQTLLTAPEIGTAFAKIETYCGV